jgi:hypothetical protein
MASQTCGLPQTPYVEADVNGENWIISQEAARNLKSRNAKSNKRASKALNHRKNLKNQYG